jgi:hypothetical protein
LALERRDIRCSSVCDHSNCIGEEVCSLIWPAYKGSGGVVEEIGGWWMPNLGIGANPKLAKAKDQIDASRDTWNASRFLD